MRYSTISIKVANAKIQGRQFEVVITRPLACYNSADVTMNIYAVPRDATTQLRITSGDIVVDGFGGYNKGGPAFASIPDTIPIECLLAMLVENRPGIRISSQSGDDLVPVLRNLVL